MGSFNLTCFASQHTIAENNKSIIIPIYQQATYNAVELSLNGIKHSQFGFAHTICYPNAFWNYAGPIFEGVYSDYGNFYLTESSFNHHNLISFFNILYDSLYKVEQGENSVHDLPIDFQSLYHPEKTYSFDELTSIWDEIWLVGKKNRLFISKNNNPRQLQFAVLHQKTMKFFENEMNNCSFPESFDEMIDEFIQSKFKLISRFILSIDTNDKTNFYSNMLKDLIDDILNLQTISNSFNCSFYNFYHDVNDETFDVISKFIQKNPEATEFNSSTLKKIKKLCSGAMKQKIIYFGLDSYNVKLSPITYGYQDYNNSVGKNYLHLIQSINGKTTQST